MGSEFFLVKPKHQFIYPNEENQFMVPNHQKKGDYFVNPCLSSSQMDFNSKNGRKWSFSDETKASISFIPIRRMCLWCPIMKTKEIIFWIRVCPNQWTIINSKNSREKFFLWSQSINIIYPKEKNVFMVPNHENKGDYYMNPCLHPLIDERWL